MASCAYFEEVAAVAGLFAQHRSSENAQRITIEQVTWRCGLVHRQFNIYRASACGY